MSGEAEHWRLEGEVFTRRLRNRPEGRASVQNLLGYFNGQNNARNHHDFSVTVGAYPRFFSGVWAHHGARDFISFSGDEFNDSGYRLAK